eukprot:5933894-Alexandrium_andersonii.AAC.1
MEVQEWNRLEHGGRLLSDDRRLDTVLAGLLGRIFEDGRGVAAARMAVFGSMFYLDKQWRGGGAFPQTERRLRGFRAVDRAK